MPKLIIDNREVTVPGGTNVLEAARALDIVIPHFCYHEALGAVGACRLCAMTFTAGPVEGVRMACMVEAQDGMVVSTTDARSAELRSHVIEWLMLDHPHDCPVCDEGGECLLQDMTVAGGHGLRRYRGQKQTYLNQDLGPFVQQEMNRCITCYRCVRTYRDYCGGEDFGVFGSRNRVSFGRFRDGRLQSPFSGNLVDVCPTGVFTDKTFRFTSRPWDLQEAPSVCPHCSLGCSTIPGGRYRQLQRVRAGVNRDTNGFFICDRGRFGYGHANHPDRPRQPRAANQPVSMSTAVTAAERRIRELADRHGGGSIAFIGSPRASLEANALLGQWAARIGSDNLLFECNAGRDRAARTAVARREGRGTSLADLRRSDLVCLIGTDLLAEGPMAALAVRQALRAGATVMAIDPRPLELPCRFEQLAASPERLPALLEALASHDSGHLPQGERTFMESLLTRLQAATAPVLIGAVDLLGRHGVDLLYDAAAALSSAERQVGVITLLAGPDSYGGALLTQTGRDFDDLIDELQEGAIKALVCLECDPYREALDPARAQAALGRLELLVALDCTPGLAAQRADIFLPSRVPAEMAGSFINHEGRLQTFWPVLEPGLPIRDTGDGGHPPRQFSSETPGAQPLPAWQILAQILDLDDRLESVRHKIVAADSRFSPLAQTEAQKTGLLPDPARPPQAALPDKTPRPRRGDALPLLAVQGFVGSDWLAHLSAPWRQLETAPCVWLHPELAASLALADQQRALLTTALGRCHVTIRTAAQMADNLVLAPQLLGSALEAMVPGGPAIDCRLDKEVAP